MSEQQPQHEPWTQPPADGAQGAQPYTGPARQVPPQQHPGQQPSPAQPNPGQQPYPTQQVPGQQPYPGQQAYPGQQGYPGQQPYAQPYAWQQHPYAAQPYREPPRMYGAMPYYPLPDQPITSTRSAVFNRSAASSIVIVIAASEMKNPAVGQDGGA